MTASNNGWKRNHWKGFGRSFTMVDKGEVMQAFTTDYGAIEVTGGTISQSWKLDCYTGAGEFGHHTPEEGIQILGTIQRDTTDSFYRYPIKPLYTETFPQNTLCTLTLTDTDGYWGDRTWKGFGQTYSLTPENAEPMSWEIINLDLFKHNGMLFSFTDRLAEGTDVTLWLWVKDIIVFVVG